METEFPKSDELYNFGKNTLKLGYERYKVSKLYSSAKYLTRNKHFCRTVCVGGGTTKDNFSGSHGSSE